jgi:hypothetical protein
MKTTKLLRIGQKQRRKPFSMGSLKSLPNIFGNDSVPISSTEVPQLHLLPTSISKHMLHMKEIQQMKLAKYAKS